MLGFEEKKRAASGASDEHLRELAGVAAAARAAGKARDALGTER